MKIRMRIMNYFKNENWQWRPKIGIKSKNFFLTEFKQRDGNTCQEIQLLKQWLHLKQNWNKTILFQFYLSFISDVTTALVNKLHAATSSGASANNQETVQGQLNRYISELTEVDMDTTNGIEFWLQIKTTYKFIEPFAVDLLSASASQEFVKRIFSLCGLMTAGRSNCIKNHWKWEH